ncbi:hypothetical protein FRC17_004520 [Serendipita sp. 399]|nr:hypothetical protein FRC17_004520 [Serendipita sp. 399]
MPPKAAKNQTSLSNWFKGRSDVQNEDTTNTDDDGEGRTLPPLSEPDSDVEEDEGRPEPGPSSAGKGKGKRKLILAPETSKGSKKPKMSKSAGSEPKKRSAEKTKASKTSSKKAITSKAKGKKKKDESEQEDVEEDDEGGSDTDMLNKAKTHPNDLKLPPLSEIPAIFKDIVSRNPKLRDVAELLQQHKDRNGANRKLRVGTMCSGTESPLLALQMISESMELDEKMEGKNLEVEHIFSCEIEPYKQAYIERNFRPPILFRDVTELGGKEATTAYGALVPVPGNIDMLIAGTSCVDYSNLNIHQKAIDEGGESGNTFYGMLSYVKNHRPPIIILENVCSAPWDKICREFEDIGYHARWLRLDTKGFYIPHTRTRGYLLAVEARRTKQRGATVNVKQIPDDWIDGMKTYMQRPASCTLDAFLLPTDDPRIHEGRQRLAIEAKNSAERRKKEVDWARCEQRHARARAEEALGNKRPLTKWEEGGTYCFLDHIWEDWCSEAVHRVKDLMDISHLRAARRGIDTSYKTTVWNLSQNVDRQIGSGRLGIAPCLTPTIIAYVTNRGGPLVGVEALGLQGLPVDRLLLTRETQDQLADLAGNAMSTTVVGSAMILALVLSLPVLEKAIEEREDHGDEDQVQPETETVVNRLPFANSLENRISGLDKLQLRPLHLEAISNTSWTALLRESVESKRWCRCEGRSSISERQMLECPECHTTSCIKCGQRPEHHYQPVTFEKPRRQPVEFAEEAKKALPMVLRLDNAPTFDELEDLSGRAGEIDPNLWQEWKKATSRALSSQLTFVDLKRQDIWVAVYEGPSARLELHLHPKRPEWRLFALPEASMHANNPVRRLLASPIARSLCKTGLLSGTWDLAVPGRHDVNLVIEGVEDGAESLTDSWEKSLGLLDSKLKDKLVWQKLKISTDTPKTSSRVFDREITGVYHYLPRCGTASNSLHRRILDSDGNEVDSQEPDLYFFLDPTRTREGSWDYFVFSTSTRRYEHDECRPIIARLDTKWRQSDEKETRAVCSVDWVWVSMDDLRCVATQPDSLYGVLSNEEKIMIDEDSCAKAQALLTCLVYLGKAPSSLWPFDRWLEIDKLHEREYLRLMAWMLQRIRNVSHDAQWRRVDLSESLQKRQCHCERCAPTRPTILWYKREKGRGNDIRAIEDSRQAAPFERALKARPTAFQIHVQYSSGDQHGRVVIGINPATLIHQAASHLPSRSSPVEAAWRLDTSYTPVPLISKPPFVIPSNRHDEPAKQPKGFKLSLRPEQLRSLKWMQQQEDTSEPFIEEEICEGTSDHLGWRLEGRARKPVSVLGGVLADQVGYGKTAIMLGLIATRNAKRVAKESQAPPGKILAKATCVIVPAHLVLQWKGEVTKFIKTIGDSPPKVVTLHQGTDINSTTIEDILDADIVIVASSMPNSEHYLDNLGSFAGVTLPNKAGRYFNARLEEAHKKLRNQVELLQREDGVKKVHDVIKDAHENGIGWHYLIILSLIYTNVVDRQEHLVQLKRLKGRAYAEANEERSRMLKSSSAGQEGNDKDLPALKKHTRRSEPGIKSKRTTASSTISSSTTAAGQFLRPIRTFIGVSVPSLKEVLARERERLKAAQRPILNEKSRRASARKSLIIDSDDSDDATSDPSSDKSWSRSSNRESEDYQADSVEEDDSESEELEPSSEEDVLVISDEESDVPPKRKPAVKRVVKVLPRSEPSKPGRKRKNMDSDIEGKAVDDGPPAKKAKIIKPKKSRATMDPWKLGDKAIRDDWTQMRSPPLDMFHFHRLVIDEFTYTKKEHVSHAIVTRLSATCRWVMSGTPPTSNFASVKGIALFLGIHLGVDDDAEGSTEEVKTRIQDKTAAEAFHSFREVRSAHWHAARHDTAQRFLDRFVRQNLAEIDDIPLEERICAVTLTASERALYLELEHYLRAQELKMKKTGKSQSDRVRRLNKALGESKTPEEALLKSASHFDCQVDDVINSTKACDIIVGQRENERDVCKRELKRKLIRAFKMQRRLGSTKTSKDATGPSHFQQALDEWQRGGDKDQDTKEILTQLVEEARDPNAVEESESGSEEETVNLNKKAIKRPGTQKQGDDLDETDLAWEHRELAHELRALAKELGGRVRSLRFFQCVRAFQGEKGMLITCVSCGRSELPLEEISILSSCGHFGCHGCVAAAAANEACIQQALGGCKVPGSSLFIVRADSLGHDKKADSDGRHWGQKLEDIVSLIKSLPSADRVLLFVQFPDLTSKVAQALQHGGLEYTEIKGSAIVQSRVLQDFQSPKSKSRILLLNLGDESASGGNLTVANHAIFISPLLAKSQFEYTQAETQAIGRIRRFGQVKTANIYRFVTRSTIDEDIYTQRGQSLGNLTQKIQLLSSIKPPDKTRSNETHGYEMDVDSF